MDTIGHHERIYAGYQIPTYFAALKHLQQLLGDNIKYVSKNISAIDQ